MKVKCKTCGKEFHTIPSRIKRGAGKYCSVSCKGQAQTVYQLGHSNPCWRGGKEERTCKNCGKLFTTPKAWVRKSNRGLCCCKKCWGEWRSKTMIRDNACNWQGGINPISMCVRTLKRYSDWRSAVYNRDGYACRNCGIKTSGTLEAHHIYPFSKILKEIVAQDNTFGVTHFDSKHPKLWDISNGITLCYNCHEQTHKENK